MQFAHEFAMNIDILTLDDWYDLTDAERDVVLESYRELNPVAADTFAQSNDISDVSEPSAKRACGRKMLPPPTHWQRTGLAWAAMTASARQSIRKKFDVRHFTSFTTRCPFNRSELQAWLDSGKCKQAQLVERILQNESNVHTCTYYKKWGQGRLIAYPWPNFTFLNRGARAVAALHTRMIDIDIANAHPCIAANIGAMCGMSRSEMLPLLRYNENRDSVLELLMKETRCDRDAVKQLFLVLLYCGSEVTWAKKHAVKLSSAILAIVTPLKQTLRDIRHRAIHSYLQLAKSSDDKMFVGIKCSNPFEAEKSRWSRICAHFECAALLAIVAVAQSAKYMCDICQLLYDGCQILPPLPGDASAESGSARGMFALSDLESDVDVALSQLPGLTYYHLHVKCKSFELPDAYVAQKRECQLIDTMKQMIKLDSMSEKQKLFDAVINPKKSYAQCLWGPDGLDPIANNHVLL